MKFNVCLTFAFVVHSFVTLCNASPNVVIIKLLVYRIIEPFEV